MKSSTKKKEEQVSKKKKVEIQQREIKQIEDQDLSVLASWNTEVESLIQNEYAGIEEAMHALIDKVIAKMEPSSSAETQEKTRQFIYEFLTGDPDIEKELKSILNIK